MFNLPIPRFDGGNALHRALSDAAARAETIAAAVPLPEAVKFQRARSLVRGALAGAGIAKEIDDLVAKLLGGGEGAARTTVAANEAAARSRSARSK